MTAVAQQYVNQEIVQGVQIEQGEWVHQVAKEMLF